MVTLLGDKAMPTHWEYMTFDLRDSADPVSELNELGELGWELIFIQSACDWAEAWLKRPAALED
jgi:hypothetical protein